MKIVTDTVKDQINQGKPSRSVDKILAEKEEKKEERKEKSKEEEETTLVADDGHCSIIPQDVSDLETLAQLIASNDAVTTLNKQSIVLEKGATKEKSRKPQKPKALTVKVLHVNLDRGNRTLEVTGEIMAAVEIKKIDRLSRTQYSRNIEHVNNPKKTKQRVKGIVTARKVQEDKLRTVKIGVDQQVAIYKIDWSSTEIAMLEDTLDKGTEGDTTKAAQEAFEEFMRLERKDPNKTKYGYKQVKYASQAHAIKTLLICDKLVQFKESDRAAVKKHVQKKIDMVENIRENGGTVLIVETDSETGLKVKSRAGYAAILWFPLEDIDEDEP